MIRKDPCESDPRRKSPNHQRITPLTVRPDSSGPNSAPRPFPVHVLAFHAPKSSTSSITRVLGLMVNVPHSEAPTHQNVCLVNVEWTGTPYGPACLMLLRKEVIQPHLPVRLPCYDFVLIASPTFDGSLHKG